MATGSSRKRRLLPEVLICVGIAVIAAAGVIYANGPAGMNSEDRSAELVEKIEGDLSQVVPSSGLVEYGQVSGQADLSELPQVELEGINIIGQLRCEAIGLDVPVAADGEDPALVPTREITADADAWRMVIRGSSYQGSGAFANVDGMMAGSDVALQLVDGTTISYVVVSQGVMNGEFNDSYDLLMYYEDTVGQKHWAGCSRVS